MAALLELGSGFNAEFTGRENVYLNGSILGFTHAEMDNLFDDIAAFADIGQFMDQAVKVYSSGMFVRLAFAVQACVKPDVLIVDEALAVGDIFFQRKCHTRMEELLAHDTAIIIVSHDMSAIERYSNQTMLIDKGRCLFFGQPNEAVRRYYHQMESAPKANCVLAENDPKLESVEFNGSIPDWPSQDAFLGLVQAATVGEENVARCTGVALCNQQGQPCSVFQIGEVAYFYYEFELLQDIGVPIGGIAITTKTNITLHAKNSLQHLIETPPLVKKGARLRFRQTVELAISPGEYLFAVTLATMNSDDYAHKTDMSHAQLHSKYQTILRVINAGAFGIRERSQGLTLPFYGLVNLNGEHLLSIIKTSYDRDSTKSKTKFELPHNAFYLFSYPRSGNTWLLNSLVTLLGAIRSEARSQFEHYPYLYGQPDPNTFFLVAEHELDMSRPLIVKSHGTCDEYKRLYPKKKCIYIFRDGRDALLSYYFYQKAFSRNEDIAFRRLGIENILTVETSKKVEFDPEEFVEFLRIHIPEWVNHVREWLETENIFKLRYEDLHQDFAGKLTQVANHLGIQPVVSATEVQRKYIEGFKQFLSGDNRQFFRKGIIGDWKNYFTGQHDQLFKELAGDFLIDLNYL